MKRAILALSLMLIGVVGVHSSASAIGLKIAPLEYRTTLKKGETKKGFIDISNPTGEAVRVKTSAQAFRQVDDEGTLQFYNDAQLTAGVKLDLDDFELGPREAVRMYFLLDSTKLASGDVYGAIFFTTEPTKAANGVGQSVKLGTLLSIVNGAPSVHQAAITALDVPWLQLDDHIKGSYTIKNTTNTSGATGFYPDVAVHAAPFGAKQTSTGKLIFAGRSRENEVSVPVFPLSIHRLSVDFQGSKKTQWVVNATPLAIIIAGLILVITAFIVRVLFIRRKRRAIKQFQNVLK